MSILWSLEEETERNLSGYACDWRRCCTKWVCSLIRCAVQISLKQAFFDGATECGDSGLSVKMAEVLPWRTALIAYTSCYLLEYIFLFSIREFEFFHKMC